MDKPKSAKGIFVVLALVVFVALALFASTWGGIIVIAVAVGLVAWLSYAGVIRIHRILLGG